MAWAEQVAPSGRSFDLESPVTIEQASSLARLPLAGITREYPNAPQLLLNGPEDLRPPRELHPAFYGCFDWHSAVHGHWCLVRLLKQFRLENEAEIRLALEANLTAENLHVEAAYLRTHPSFERMYGWAWLLTLVLELRSWNPDGARWARWLLPLEQLTVEFMLKYLPKLRYPIRAGTHANTAFALNLAWDYAATVGNSMLGSTIHRRARAFFGKDSEYPAHLEPSGADFLSPALVEADLMRRVSTKQEFGTWLSGFLPGLAKGEPKSLFEPAEVTDHADGQACHLDGLNLSRAWSMRGIASALGKADAAKQLLLDAADRHLEAAMPFVASGHYAGEHWLASFAVLASSDGVSPS